MRPQRFDPFRLAEWFLLALAILTLLAGIVVGVRGAPAPLPKRAAEVAEKHPGWMLGDHALKFAGTLYEARLHGDGSLWVRAAGSEWRWQGTWGVRDNQLHWREWCWYGLHAPPPTARPGWHWHLTWTGKGWECEAAQLTRPTRPID